MRIGAYQFAVTGDVDKKVKIIVNAIQQAVSQKVKLLVFPECALTGYPPHDMSSSSEVDFDKLALVYEQLQKIVDDNDICIIVGTIMQEESSIYNSAIVFIPFKEKVIYHKRALWGWDKDNFCNGHNDGTFLLKEWKIGIRICFEVRFPEYFRDLYRASTDLNIILFYDASDFDDKERYDLIKSHIRTRAVENVTHTLTVDTIKPYQTAPTLICDKSGEVLCEAKRNEESLVVYDLEKEELNFGEQGRKEISDWLTVNSNVWWD